MSKTKIDQGTTLAELENQIVEQGKILAEARETMTTRRQTLADLGVEFERLSLDVELKRLRDPGLLGKNEAAQAEAKKLVRRSESVVSTLQAEHDSLVEQRDAALEADYRQELAELEATGKALNEQYAELARLLVGVASEIHTVRGEMTRRMGWLAHHQKRTGYHKPAIPFSVDGFLSTKGKNGPMSGPNRLEGLLRSRPWYAGNWPE